MKYNNIREEEIKNKVASDWFTEFDTTQIIGNIDFSVFPEKDNIFHSIPLLWAEAKKGDYDVVAMFVQLILTIGKARTYTRMLPPAFLGAFDSQKFAFVPYNSVESIFSINDFNWNVTPSNYETKEFALIKERIEADLQLNSYVFDFEKDAKELRFFISHNLANATDKAKQTINKSNFVSIYLRWLEVVKPIINANWNSLKKKNILDCDFYLADLFVDDKGTPEIDDDTPIYENLFVLFANQGYTILQENLQNTEGFDLSADAFFRIKDKTTYQNFWKLYKRPPHSDYHDYIIERRELLVEQDIRERKGAFFTPRQWVALSQQYLSDYFGENWQDEYYIWDCAAGTGNLLAGLTNKYNIFASTLDQADVNVMYERIQHGALLKEEHVFQFDFLNDDFIAKRDGGKLPNALFDIITNEEKRKKLIVYINPPYAEAGGGTGKHKAGVSIEHKIYKKYKNTIKKASIELFAQFLIRIYKEIPNSKIANFSKLKNLQSSNFSDFRKEYRAKLEKIFLVPADTFDNVKGQFPIGFFIWNSEKKELFKDIIANVYNRKGELLSYKSIYSYDDKKGFINNWLKTYYDKKGDEIGIIHNNKNDFQHNNQVRITTENIKDHTNIITKNNLIQISIYFAVRHCIEATWENDRDQFLFPNAGWEKDKEFQGDCLTFTLFHGQNRISSKEGANHWIPFTEQEVNAPTLFSSHFMTDFIKGNIKPAPLPQSINLFTAVNIVSEPEIVYGPSILLSEKAKAVFKAGRELWKYYFTQPDTNVNASLYDIREHFQGRNDKGKMNNKSNDVTYNQLINNLREALNRLALQIEPKVYEYGFLL